MNPSIADAYQFNRRELYLACKAQLAASADADRALSHLFWENAWCAQDGKINTFFYPLPPETKRVNVQSFDQPRPPEIERTDEGFLRLCVTTNWVLKLAGFGSFDNWFAALSQKNRKKLRWLRNALPKEGIQIVPLETEAQFDSFYELYLAQFPHARKHPELNRIVRAAYQFLIGQKRSFSFILLDADKNPVAANLGYLNGESFYFTHLTRKKGILDKFSPGTYLTFFLVEKLFREHPDIHYFFMGPGKYDYKPAFLAEPLAIYRYEKRSLWNLPGLIRLCHRLKKERKKFVEA